MLVIALAVQVGGSLSIAVDDAGKKREDSDRSLCERETGREKESGSEKKPSVPKFERRRVMMAMDHPPPPTPPSSFSSSFPPVAVPLLLGVGTNVHFFERPIVSRLSVVYIPLEERLSPLFYSLVVTIVKRKALLLLLQVIIKCRHASQVVIHTSWPTEDSTQDVNSTMMWNSQVHDERRKPKYSYRPDADVPAILFLFQRHTNKSDRKIVPVGFCQSVNPRSDFHQAYNDSK